MSSNLIGGFKYYIVNLMILVYLFIKNNQVAIIRN